MKYRDLCGNNVSVLGLGCMRLPEKKNANGKSVIDYERFAEMAEYAYENGVNYFDTAYMYHDYTSEIELGKALRQLGIRDKVYIADKLPPWNVNSKEDVLKVFEEQLQKTGLDYFDYYLLHNMSSEHWNNTIKKYDVMSVMRSLKESGRIRHLGFSFHDDLDAFKDIIDEGGEDFEFCQIQLNYADAASGFQAGLKGLEYAHLKGLDVIIMEPLRGGKLACPPEHVKEKLPEGKSAVEIGLDFLWDRPEVNLVLSGMSSMEQLKENIEYAKRAEPGMLTDAERAAVLEAGEAYNSGARVGCTGCAYCMPCSVSINIPEVFRLYNKQALEYSWETGQKDAYKNLEVKADSCVLCGKCTSHCPQNLEIPKLLKEAHISLS